MWKSHDVLFKNFCHQIIENLPQSIMKYLRVSEANEIVRFLRYVYLGFLWKKNDFFFKIGKGDKFAVECA